MKHIMEEYGDMYLSGIIIIMVIAIYLVEIKAGGMLSEIVSNYLMSIAG